MPLSITLPAGLLLSLLVGLAAYWRGSLDRSGVLGAILVGALVFGFGGPILGLLLIAFFVSSSLLSAYRLSAKTEIASAFQKGPRRDLAQTLANGGLAALLSVLYYFSPLPVVYAAFLGALAAATADTWATEMGVLSPVPPRLVTTWRPVPAGTSGAVSVLGLSFAFSGAAFIGLCALVPYLLLAFVGLAGYSASDLLRFPFLFLPLTALAGWLAALFDSFLGAARQAIYYCEFDRQETERRVHRCGRPTRFLRGWRWLDNDAVNFLATVSGACFGALGYLALAR